MIAEIIAAGSEMLTPFRQDTNSLYLTDGLNDLGVQVAFKTIVGDNLSHLTSAALIALSRADIVIFSGGLGPTHDDLTREAVAAALGIGLNSDNAVLAALYKRFAARQMVMPPNNAKQADVLDGATILENQNGSAPGQYIDTTVIDANVKPIRKIVILLPGPPKELKPLFDTQVKPRLAVSLPIRHLAKRTLRMALIPESHVDARTAPIYQKYSDIETTILAGAGEIQLHFLCAKPTLAEAQDRADELAERIEAEMEDAIFPRTANRSKRLCSSISASATSPLPPPKAAPAVSSRNASPPSPAARATSSAAPSSTATLSKPPSPTCPPRSSQTKAPSHPKSLAPSPKASAPAPAHR